MNIDFLTVVYRNDLDFLKKQAQSFSTYVNDDNVKNLYVILNDDNLTHADIDISWWNTNKDKVRVIHRNDIGYFPPATLWGWYTQQLCKILGTANCESDWCFIFDSKTFMVNKFYINLVFQENRARFSKVKVSEYWQPGFSYLKKVYNVLELDSWVSPGGVPFMAHVPTMRAMVDDNLNFIEWFHTHCLFYDPNIPDSDAISEFLCYSVWVFKENLFKILYNGKQLTTNYNYEQSMAQDFEEWMQRVEDETEIGKVFTASIHPTAFKLLTTNQQERWLNYLKKRNII